jgi:hypothetical protein
MTGRIFFRAENVKVSSHAVTVGGGAFPIEELSGVRGRRVGRWFWESYEVILSRRVGEDVRVLRHRNAYFAFQLVRAIEAALVEQRVAERGAALSA